MGQEVEGVYCKCCAPFPAFAFKVGETADSLCLLLSVTFSIHRQKRLGGNRVDSTTRPSSLMVFYTEHEMSSGTLLDARLASSLKTFGQLYDERAELLSTTSDKLVLTATCLCQNFRFAVVEFGKNLGCLLGGFSGGIFGTASALVWSESGAEDVTLGVVGGILGGVAGGALGGAVGVVATVSWELSRHPVYDVGKEAAWLFGFAAGGVAGGVAGGAIGGPVGATGGALGGVLGALWVVKYANQPHKKIIRFVVEDYQRKKRRLDQPAHHEITSHLRDFRGAVKPLLNQLKQTRLICGEMASRRHTHAIASQAAASLDSAAKMEVAIEKARRTTSPLELILFMVAGAELSKNVNKELEEMRKEAEKFLQQLRGDPEDPVQN